MSNVTEKACDSVRRVDHAEVPNETLLTEVVKEVEVPSVNDVQGCFAVVLYYEIRYVGKVLEVDAEDDTLDISFMENCVKMEGKFRWPKPEDKLCIHKSDVLKCIEPIAMAKTRRMFSVNEDVISFMQNFHSKSN